METRLPSLARVVNGWQMNTEVMGVYGDYFLKRAIIAMAGLGANQALDAIYPLSLVDTEGRPYDGTLTNTMHFDRDHLPPVRAFWSITMYDAESFQCANELDRFAIDDRDALTYNPDGSLDLFFQHAKPEAEKVASWLPAPVGGWNLCMRTLKRCHGKVGCRSRTRSVR